jgi:branched-chain amino acid transport system ATP-binding protein
MSALSFYAVLGRAFVAGRRLMLLDEPSMGLSPVLMKREFHFLKEINLTEETAILPMRQNARLELKFANRGNVLENGNMVLPGSWEELLGNQKMKKTCLGG